MGANVSVPDSCNNNVLIIAVTVTVVVLVIIFMYFRDRQQKRNLELQRLETQGEVWEEWGPPGQNRQPTNTPGKGGKIL